MVDLIIRSGHILDGTGAPARKGDIAVQEGKIVEITDSIDMHAEREWNAAGKYVCPGFIDIHTHSDFSLLANRFAESSVRQGITTLVTGNCGHGPAPSPDRELGKQVTIGYSENFNTDFGWDHFAEYLEDLFSPGLSVNVAPLVPHGSIRLAVMGYDARPPTKVELEKMKDFVDDAMSAGAAGFSTGLEYSPGQHADKNELIALCSVAASHGGIYASHIRNRADTFMESVIESLNIIRKAGCPGQLSHLAPRPYANEKFDEVLETIYQARDQESLEIGIDTFPDVWAPGPVVTLLPPWVYEDTPDRVLDRLNSPDVVDQCRETFQNPTNYLLRLGGFESFYLTCSKSYPELVGRNFQEISEIFGADHTETIFKLVLADGSDFYNVMLRHIYATPEDLQQLLLQPICSIESDGVTTAPYGPLKDFVFNRSSYCYTIRFLMEYVIDQKLFTLEEGIRKMTSLPADSARLKGRGRLKEDYTADILIFSLEDLKDNTTDDKPSAYPDGIELVMVNGSIVLEQGTHSQALPGQMLPN
ncbi:MAG TPA: D-aminoacylase [Candidatus Marinimicrobia bacterium]|nr:D-aminoacylase [Candidatus Neomarinimicrobiota bacterium]HIB32669.1 D-aminoacylase [Candidatus Neomarinimicrobiota bacterium]